MKSPQRGELWIVDLGMAAKARPALVVSLAATDDDRTMVTVVPHTTRIRGTRFEVNVPLRLLKEGTFDCQNLITIPRAKFLRRLGKLGPDDITKIETAIRSWLGLAP